MINVNISTNSSKPTPTSFHEFLRAYTNIFSRNVMTTKDYTYHNLKELIKDENVVVVPGDKDSCVIVMNKSDYVQKLQDMIDEGINRGVYTQTTNNTPKDLKTFCDFLYRNFKNHPKYQKIFPTSNQYDFTELQKPINSQVLTVSPYNNSNSDQLLLKLVHILIMRPK